MTELRDKFFKECTEKSSDGLKYINMTPHNLFEWFKENMQGQTLPLDSFVGRSKASEQLKAFNE